MGSRIAVRDILNELQVIKLEMAVDKQVGHVHATVFLWKHEKLILDLLELQLTTYLNGQGGGNNGKETQR